jgi:Ala-tRNA(Pro) deacylase
MPENDGTMIAPTLRAFLEAEGVDYEIVPHAPADTSSETAEAAHIPGRSIAKAVVVEGAEHRVVVVVPAHEHIHLGELRRELGATYALMTEADVRELFRDCEGGPVPPFGQAYGLDVLVDDTLLEQPRVYVEGGARAALLAIPGHQFRRLMRSARTGRYGHPGPPAGAAHGPPT